MKMAQLWGGRFTKETDKLVYNFNASISFDQKFYKQDIEGSIAHAKSQIEEKYGRYEEFECDNPEKFADDMSVAVAELEKNIEKYAQLRKHMSDELRDTAYKKRP